MGALTSCCCCRPRRFNVLLHGLDNAGKTSALYHLMSLTRVVAVPTPSFNLENLEHNGVPLTVYDLGGGDKFREMWVTNLVTADAEFRGVIFMVDATDRKRIASASSNSTTALTAKTLLQQILAQERLNGVPLLILSNKHDLPDPMSDQEIMDQLEIRTKQDGRSIHIQDCSAVTGEGLKEGLDWLTQEILSQPAKDSQPEQSLLQSQQQSQPEQDQGQQHEQEQEQEHEQEHQELQQQHEDSQELLEDSS